MDVGVNLDLNIMTIVITILNVVLMGVGIYVMYLLIKALRIYIKKNSNKDSDSN